MKILIVSGFLGAGKTTFIKMLAKQTGKDFVVLENEYGDVGIDGTLLSSDNTAPGINLNVWELAEGCVCCSIKADFVTSVLTISNTLNYEFLVIEPTGVALLSNVIENIKKIEYERITLLSPVTILDGHSYERYCAEFTDIYLDQIATAGTIVVSKMESASKEDISYLERQIKQHNSSAEIVFNNHRGLTKKRWNSLLSTCINGDAIIVRSDETPHFDSIGLSHIQLDSENELLYFLQQIICLYYGDIVRAKGYLKAGRSWLRFDVVDRLYAITGTGSMKESRGVFIGRNIKRSLLRNKLKKNSAVTHV